VNAVYNAQIDGLGHSRGSNAKKQRPELEFIGGTCRCLSKCIIIGEMYSIHMEIN